MVWDSARVVSGVCQGRLLLMGDSFDITVPWEIYWLHMDYIWYTWLWFCGVPWFEAFEGYRTEYSSWTHVARSLPLIHQWETGYLMDSCGIRTRGLSRLIFTSGC